MIYASVYTWSFPPLWRCGGAYRPRWPGGLAFWGRRGGARNFCLGDPKIQGVWVAAGPPPLWKVTGSAQLPQLVSQIQTQGPHPPAAAPGNGPLITSIWNECHVPQQAAQGGAVISSDPVQDRETHGILGGHAMPRRGYRDVLSTAYCWWIHDAQPSTANQSTTRANGPPQRS